MSKTPIPTKVVTRLWVLAGGRCEFQGHNDVLWRDGLTMAQMNNAYVAHIISDSPDGPRGDPVLSPKLAKDISNLMLLCPTHHTLIDKEEPDRYTVEILQGFKRAHEERIEYLTGLMGNPKTQVLICRDNIAGRRPPIAVNDAHLAILPRFPASERPIEFDLSTSPFRDHEDGYYDHAQTAITRHVENRLRHRHAGDAIEHLSVFGLASQPLLIHLGQELGEAIASDVFDFHRDTCSWEWQPSPGDVLAFTILGPEPADEPGVKTVVLNLSLSDRISIDDIKRTMKRPFVMYTVTTDEPARDRLKTRAQLQAFVDTMRRFIPRLRLAHGSDCEIHVFPAMPASAAVRLGQLWNPKCDPPMRVYEFNASYGGFFYALTVPRRRT